MTNENKAGRTVAGDASRFGVFLPSYIWEGDGAERVRGLLDFAREVERLGFDSIFITDHVVAARHFYDVSWLDPLTTLTFVSAVTERVRLGTSILTPPLRHPVLLAKQIATIGVLSKASGKATLPTTFTRAPSMGSAARPSRL